MKNRNAGYLRTLPGLVTMLGVTSLLVLSSARGELLFSDSFDYPAGKLDGQGPPPGSPPGQGGWVASNHSPAVATFGLDFPRILTAGNSALLDSIFGMVSDEAIAAIGPVTPDIGVVWIGFLTRKASNQSQGGGFAAVAGIGARIIDRRVGIGMSIEGQGYGPHIDTVE